MSKLCGLLCIALLLISGFAHAQNEANRHFLPIGGGYADTFDGFLQVALDHAAGDAPQIYVLPITFPYTIADEGADREENIAAAEDRRAQLEEACVELNPDCSVEMIPVFSRAEAEDENVYAAFAEAVQAGEANAVFILGGDQTVAMQIVSGTPLEDVLADAYASGIPIAGTSAGAAIQSQVMIGGYAGDEWGPENALHRDSIDLWAEDRGGLSFGVEGVIFDQHFNQRSRLPRLLTAMALSDGFIGVGVDAYTGVSVHNETAISDVFGLYTVTILDMTTYRTEAAPTFGFTDDGLLWARNVLLHILAPGDFSWENRRTSLADVPASLTRTYDALVLPEGAGELWLSGGQWSDEIHETLEAFRESCGGADNVVLLGADNLADSDVEGAACIAVILEGQENGPDQAAFAPIVAAWRAGAALFLDDAAAAYAGVAYSQMANNTQEDEADEEPFTQGTFIQGGATISEGLGLLNIVVEPQIMRDNRWGRLFAATYANPDALALAIPHDTAIRITSEGASVVGFNGVFVLDLRQATLALGDNDAFVIANALLDVFAPSETLTPIDANAATE